MPSGAIIIDKLIYSEYDIATKTDGLFFEQYLWREFLKNKSIMIDWISDNLNKHNYKINFTSCHNMVTLDVTVIWWIKFYIIDDEILFKLTWADELIKINKGV